MKDYYKILEITPAATEAEIKKAYRRLALKYHPDKNFGNSLSEARFKEIKEAYEVLRDNTSRIAYNFKRSTSKYAPQPKPYVPVTPQLILKNAVDFRRKVMAIDPERLNKTALFRQIQVLISRHNILLLQQYNDTAVNGRMIEEVLHCSETLTPKLVDKVCLELVKIAGTDNSLFVMIHNFARKSRYRYYWHRYKFGLALVVVVVLCALIYFLSSTI